MKNSALPQRAGYLPTLDGWRALAILAVMFHHDGIHSLGFLNTQFLYQYGYVGVDVFFAISGILICSRLLDEERIEGSISLRRFYIRRCFRILPPALLYLGVLAVLAKASLISVTRREFAECLLFCRNYPNIFEGLGGHVGWYTEHFWSLSLEEQFYLLLPAIICLSAKRYRVPILGGLAAIITVHRSFALHTRPWGFIASHPDVRLDSLLVPALLAVLATTPEVRLRFQRYLRFWPLLAAATICILSFGVGTSLHASALDILISFVVLGSVLNPDNAVGKILEWRPLRYIGRISYSLYLWQQLFFTEHFVLPKSLGAAQRWPLCLFLTFGAALFSYYVVERPLAQLGHRLAPSATSGRDGISGGPGNDELKPELNLRRAVQ